MEILAQHVSARLYFAEVSYSSIHWIGVNEFLGEHHPPPGDYEASYLLYCKWWNGRHGGLNGTGLAGIERV
jgi:hypothetical protein